VREVGNKFHRNFVVGFKAHPWNIGFT
jgi:hypothetical protein